MWGNGKFEVEDIIAGIALAVCLSLIVFAMFHGAAKHDERCAWELERGIESFECRDWESE